MRLIALIALAALAACTSAVTTPPPVAPPAPQLSAEERAAQQRAAAFEELSGVIDQSVWLPFVIEDGGERLPYRLHVPANLAPGQSAPLVLLLHGAGERDADNLIQLLHGAREIAAHAAARGEPVFILAPQAPRTASWGGFQPSFAAEPVPHGRLALAAVERVMQDYPIDRSRVYITGLSMGGFGTFELVARRPDLFAAALPVCGGGHPSTADALAQTPFWVFHGALDEVIPVQRSRDMVAAIEAAGGAARYTEYPDLTHNSWDATYGNPEALDWMLAQRRAP
jgi:predicted peptidase